MASQSKVTEFEANIEMECAGKCVAQAIRTGLVMPGAIPISPSGVFRTTVRMKTTDGEPITVSVDARLTGKSAAGTLRYSPITSQSGGRYSGGNLDFTASLEGAATATMLRAYGDVVFSAAPPYGYAGARVTVRSASEVDQDIASVGARTLRTWSSQDTSCKTMQNVATSPVSPDGHFVNTRSYRFADPGTYTICAELLNSLGRVVTPLVSSVPPPWPVSPILICPVGTTIIYNAAVAIGCKKRG